MDPTSPRSTFKTVKASTSSTSRTIVVTKDDDGYGLTLSGDNPVFVQTVKPGGAADRAGVQRGDIIVRVNGQVATKMGHTDVVFLIQAAPSVAITVIQANQPLDADFEMGLSSGSQDIASSLPKQNRASMSPNRSNSMSISFLPSSPLQDGLKSSSHKERITSPQPPNTEAIRALKDEEEHTLQLMMEKVRRDVDQLRQERAKSSDATLQREIESKKKILKNLEERLKVTKVTQEMPVTSQFTFCEEVPSPPPRHDLVPPHPIKSSSQCMLPPPLPARNRPQCERTQDNEDNTEAPPPLPPPRQSMPLPPPPVLDKRGFQQSPLIFQKNENSSKSPPSHERSRSSPSSFNESWDVFGRSSPRYETPPGTPPPPYFGNEHELSSGSGLVTWDDLTSEVRNRGIINMEDEDEEDVSEPEISIGLQRAKTASKENSSACEVDVHKTPFDDLRGLQSHPAHLAVFINFVLSSNLDPSSLFFYLITEDYKLGQVKEMQRWAYEIHSSFLVPNAPLVLTNIDSSIVYEIDRDLQEAFDCENRLRKLFWKARSTARKDLRDQLSEFREKRTAGLGSMFAPQDFDQKQHNLTKREELQIMEELLLPFLEQLSEKLETATDRCLAVMCSLATIMSKVFKLRSPTALPLLERCPTYVSKEKKPSRMFPRAKKSTLVNGHHFEPCQYNHVTYCNQSQQRIWGISPQGYRCAYCGFDVQKKFVNRVDESCVGPAHKKNRLLTKLTDIQIPNRKQQSISLGTRESSGFFFTDEQGEDHSNHSQSETRNSPSVSELSEVQTVPGSFNSKTSTSPTNFSKSHPNPFLSEGLPQSFRTQSSASLIDQPLKSVPKVDRSQSCKIDKKDSMRNIARDRRKHSDPSIPSSIVSDGDPELHPINIANQTFGSSSTSSLSVRSPFDSPASSTQEGFHGQIRSGGSHAVTSSSSFHIHTTHGSTDNSFFQQSFDDSDFETEVDPPDWRLSMSIEELEKLKPWEKKRQDIINEFFHTERSHVRNLKVLDRVFFRPLKETKVMESELIDRLFPNLEEVLSVHVSFSQKMREKIKAGYPIGSIAHLLSEMFEGSHGDCLIRVGSEFTKNQKFSIEELKEKRRKDHKVESFLAEQEKRPECRRLQLQSILPVEHQRLVKYPLLLEQLFKQCDKDSDENEFNTIKKCVERTREILESIDRQVAEAQNIHRLEEIQRNLDTSGMEKMNDNSFAQYKNLDLTKHRLIYDGPLTLKLGDLRRLKTVDLHAILLENCLMLLQKQDEKYALKFHTFPGNTSSVSGLSGPGKICHSPIITFDNILIRTVATDKRALYLINTTEKGPQIYELTAGSTAERTQWFRHITEATAAYRERSAKSAFNGYKDDRENDINKKLQSPRQGNYDQSFSEYYPHHDRQRGFLDDSQEMEPFVHKTGPNESVEDHRRLQCVEIQKVAEASPFVDPSEVVVTHSEVHIADPILSPLEKLRRKDLEVARALEEKQRLIAEILHIPIQNFELIADIASQPAPDKDAKEVLLAALDQAKSLSDLVNASLTLNEKDTVAAAVQSNCQSVTDSNCLRMQADKLMGISSNMNQHLTSLLAIIQAGDDEKESLRKELQRSRDQVDALLSQKTSSENPSTLTTSFEANADINASDSSGGDKLCEKMEEEEPLPTTTEEGQ